MSLTPSKTDATTQPQQSGCTVDQYAKDKHLNKDVLTQNFVAERKQYGKPAVRIAYLDANKKEIAVRYRINLRKNPGADDNRFVWGKGSKVHLYGAWKQNEVWAKGYVLLVEGESDCHTAWQHNLPAYGVPGAGIWKEEWSTYFDDLKPIYIIVEPDSGGFALLKKIKRSELTDRVKLVYLKNAKDLNELHCKYPDPTDFRSHLDKALEEAQAWTDYEAAEKELRKKIAWSVCEKLAQEKDILSHFASNLEDAGFAGELKTPKLLYLIATSRVLDKIVSTVVKAPSSAGKSFLVESVLKYFPDDAYYQLTSMSEHALAYDDEPIQHRMLVIAEAAGMTGDNANYLIRSLLSEGKIRHITVEKTEDGLRPLTIEREGPTGLIITTTNVRLHPENETRLLTLSISDSAEQTKNVLHAIASEEHRKPEYKDWHALQTWLSLSSSQVTVPFAKTLAGLIPPVAVRLRRDFGALLNLTRAHAILHRATRESNHEGRVVATYDDYAAVRELVSDILSEGLEITVPQHIRETVAMVAKLHTKPYEGEGGLTYAAIGNALGIHKATARARVEKAIEAGYLKNLALPRKPARVIPGDPLPDDQEILPTVETLINGCEVAPENPGVQVNNISTTEQKSFLNIKRGGGPYDEDDF